MFLNEKYTTRINTRNTFTNKYFSENTFNTLSTNYKIKLP